MFDLEYRSASRDWDLLELASERHPSEVFFKLVYDVRWISGRPH